MSKQKTLRRWIAILLVVALLPVVPFQFVAAASTSENLNFYGSDYAPNTHLGSSFFKGDELQTPPYKDTDVVRVSIVLNGESTIDAGFNVETIATDKKAVAYREKLEATQDTVTERIEKNVLGGKDLDVVWNLTLAANIISANVEYGQIESIKNISGVKDVVIETQYAPDETETDADASPNMATSGSQIGSEIAWLAGYTGAGRKIAIIDTGLDVDHISFDSGAFEHSLKEQGLTVDLFDAGDIADVLEQLNVYKKNGVSDASKLYQNSKVPFAYNYVDGNFDVSHFYGSNSSEHGSHVAGIAAANAYIPDGNGGYEEALTSVFVQGVASDAQLVIMKVFGASGGAYDSDYFAAVEDAILLGCDAANLSLGSVVAGWNASTTYGEILDSLTEKGLVMVTSAGNNSSWPENTTSYIGYLYADDVNFHTGGNPGAFANTFAVASVENAGGTGKFITLSDGSPVFYTDHADYGDIAPLTSIAGEREYIFFDADITAADLQVVAGDLQGKILVCSYTDDSSFRAGVRLNFALANGAIAYLEYYNTSGRYYYGDVSGNGWDDMPIVTMTQASGAAIKATSTPVTDDSGNVLYYTGKMTVNKGITSAMYNAKYYTMSDFSSWGVPGSLTLKPEITAPGGNIYSVYGANAGTGLTDHDQYEQMSGTSMAAPQITGMIAVLDQFLEAKGYSDTVNRRTLALSLLMSTAVPMEEDFGEDTNTAGFTHSYYPVLRQGAGLANVGNAVNALSYILMGKDATVSYADGKVKAEVGESKEGKYTYSFTVNNLNGEDLKYTLATDMFTQDVFEFNGDLFLDTWTTLLLADVVYTVDGVTFVPRAGVDADVNKDGVTNAADAQALLEYIVGNDVKAVDGSELNLKVGDLDEDGVITTYDAHLLLATMETESFTVPANGSVTVTVSIEITDDLSDYENGAYVEGYTFVNPVGDEDGVIKDVQHSIPILGFYGSWTDPSMFEQNSTVESLYGDDHVPYVVDYTQYNWNYLTYKSAADGNTYLQIGNPYGIEKTYPVGKAAINSKDTIYQIGFTLIRNAASMGYVITDAETNEIYFATAPTSYGQYNYAAYYSSSSGAWNNTGVALTANKTLASLGLPEGTTVNVSLVAIPEYYFTEDQLGVGLTLDEFKDLIASEVLGGGAYLTTTLTIDNTAPEIKAVTKDLVTGALTVTATDNENIAYMAVLTRSGTKLYTDVLAPEGENGKVEYTFDASELESVGSKCMILVADYAGNETAYVVEYGGEDPDLSNTMFAFNGSNISSYYAPEEVINNAWLTIDPETVAYNYGYNTSTVTGMEPYAYFTEGVVSAAEYIDGYVFFTVGTKLYVSELLELDNATFVSDLSQYGIASVSDMAYNMADGKLYALEYKTTNNVYSINPLNGAATLEFTVDGSVVSDISSAKAIRTLAISNDGTFYAATYYYTTNYKSKLLSWTLNDITGEDGAKTVTPDVVGTIQNGSTAVQERDGTMTWDHSTNKLYLANSYYMTTASTGYTSAYSTTNFLWEIDTTSGAATKVNDNGTNGAKLYFAARGLFVVPGGTAGGPDFSETNKVDSLTISASSLEIFVGGSEQLSYNITPWTLKDKTVTWSSSDDTVAIVDANGLVFGVEAGTATITVTSNADNSKTATCEVTVKPLPDIEISALIFDTDSKTYWSDYNVNNTAGWSKIDEIADGEYMSGALVNGMLYVHNGSAMFAVDPDTFEVKPFGAIDFPFSDAAAIPTFASAGYEFAFIPMGYNYILLGSSDMSVTNAGSGWNMSTYITGSDMPAAIAHYQTAPYSLYGDADYLYLITEQGSLIRCVFFNGGSCYRTVLGTVDGVNLEGVNAGNGYASLIYVEDEDGTGYLVLTSYTTEDDNVAKMQLIDPTNLKLLSTTYFGDDVWPVVSNYQYERATDLTIKTTSPSTISIDTGKTYQLDVWAILGTTNEIEFTSDNTSVATVDADGLINAVAEGTATITAKTKDTTKDGENLSLTFTVNVRGVTKLETNATIGAYVETDNGAVVEWAKINLGDLSTTTTKSVSDYFVDAGGKQYDGNFIATLYGQTAGTIWQINGSTFAVGTGKNLSSLGTTYYPIVDATMVPTFNWTVEDSSYSGTALDGFYLYVTSSGRIAAVNWTTNSVTGWNFGTSLPFAAVAFDGLIPSRTEIGDTPDEGESDEGALFYFLDTKGNLYMGIMYGNDDDSLGFSLYYTNYNVTFDVARADSVSMEVIDAFGHNYTDSLIFAVNQNGQSDLYYVDILAESGDTQCLGSVEGATLINSLYSDAYTPSSANSIGAKTVSGLKPVAAVDTVTATLGTVTYTAPETVDVKVNDDALTTLAAAPKADATNIGSLNAADDEGNDDEDETVITKNDSALDTDDKTFTVTVAADDFTNGLYTVEYDADILTLVSVDAKAAYVAVNDTESGKVVVAFADKEEYAGVIAVLVFSYEDSHDGIDTDVTLTTLENGEPSDEDPTVETFDVEVDPTEHVWGAPVFNWSEDGTTATATFTCQLNPEHTETVDATMTSEVTTPATETEEGTMTYTATVVFNGETYTDTNDVAIPVVEPETVKVTVTVENGTSDAPGTAVAGKDLSFTLTPDEGYELPETIVVTVDGKELDPSLYTYDPETGAVVIKGEAVTGDVEVKVTATEVDNSTDGPAKTGDDFSVFTWLAILAMSAMGFAIAFVPAKDKRRVK